MEWPERAVEDIAAIWAVRRSRPHTRPPSAKRIEQVKSVVHGLHIWPAAFYTLPPFIVAGPLRGTTLKYDDIKMRFAQDEQLHDLAVKWVIAVEKAKRQWPMSEPARVVFRWISCKLAEDGTLKRNQTGDGFWRFFLEKEEPVRVTKSNKDELVLWIDGHDSRWWLPVQLEPD